jgi:hypothetical protein
MAAEAKMLGVWAYINNPNRSTSEDLNLQVGGTVRLNTEALRLLAGQLLTIKAEIMDEDTAFDDLLLTDESFQLGVHDTDYHCFNFGVIVPYQTLNDCEPFYEGQAEVYDRLTGHGGGVTTNRARCHGYLNVEIDS